MLIRTSCIGTPRTRVIEKELTESLGVWFLVSTMQTQRALRHWPSAFHLSVGPATARINGLPMMSQLGCDREPDLPLTTEPPARACPAPAIPTSQWQTIVLKDWGIRLRLPRHYARDRGAEDPSGSWKAFRTVRLDSVEVTVDSGGVSKPVFYVVQPDLGYSECRETIAGHEATIQSYRGGGEISYRGRKVIAYRCEAAYEIAPERVLRIRANTTDRKAQEEILAAFRTVEFKN